jgi:hypothetical protein
VSVLVLAEIFFVFVDSSLLLSSVAVSRLPSPGLQLALAF